MDTATNKPVRVRFAPSPTGFVHIGSLRAALSNFLFARHNGGVNILRVEDTDQARKVEGAVENMISVMASLGVTFDEGPYIDNGNLAERGEHGPYTQSARLGLYLQHVQILLDAKQAYYCFCSTERLNEIRKEQIALKKPAMYDKHCRNLSAEDIAAQQAAFLAADKQPVVRMAIPLEGTTTLCDLVFGDITYENAVIDDQVLLKSDGFPTYHLAVVVDDHLMEISHVIRGDDWIPSTPKHLLLYKAFGWEAPQFAHLPLILNPDKTKLSKRQGDVAAEDFVHKGYIPEALVNFVALLGWNPKTEQELFTMDELIAQFDIAKINKAGAVLDIAKLDWMNGSYLRAMATSDLVVACKPYWQAAGVAIDSFKPEYLEAITALEQDRLKKLSDITDHLFYFAQPEYEGSMLIWKKSDASDAKTKLILLKDFFAGLPDADFNKEHLETKLKEFITTNGFDNGSVLWPLRVALTGLERSPGPFEVASVLHAGMGKEEIVSRLQVGIDKLSV